MTDTHERWKALLKDEQLPCAVVDLDAVDHNQDTLLGAMAPGPTMRLASKSLRCPALLKHLATRGGPRVAGYMTWSVEETALLADQGLDDLLLGYPLATRRDALRFCELAGRGVTVTAMVDSAAQVDLLAGVARRAGVTARLCLDVDVSLRTLGQHFGVRRSPIRSADAAAELARHIGDTAGLRLVGLMAYEAQVAGLPDVNPGSRALDPVRGMVKKRSIGLAALRRAEVVATLRERGVELELVNGGGTGSVASTSRDPSVTEVTAGSGFLCPVLFDGYHGLPLQPAAFFALPVVRASDPGYVTCAYGGYVASGPPGPDRMPRVWLPRGVEPVELEAWGEVQTPLVTNGATLELGDPVIARHAKAGELFEHFAELLLVRGTEVVDRVPTMRGLGCRFG